MSQPYQTFDIDLREGQAREDAFVHVFLRSRVEHKNDKKAGRTGNAAFEIAQICRDGRIRDSGVMKESDTWAHQYAPDCWIVMPTSRARALAMICAERWGGKWIGDGDNHFNVLVPIELLVRPG